MNKRFFNLKSAAFAVLAIMTANSLQAQDKLPAKKKIFADMAKANDYFMAKWPDAGAPVTVVTNGKSVTRTSELWTRAVYYEGVMAFNEVNPDKKLLNYAVEWSEKHKWSPRGAVNTPNADNQCCGQTYVDLYRNHQKMYRPEHSR
jgi:hypothetical protein